MSMDARQEHGHLVEPVSWNITISMDARQEHGRLEEPVSRNMEHYRGDNKDYGFFRKLCW